MRSSRVACSRMTWLVIGTLRALTTSASRRSTRNWMSDTSPSRSSVIVLQEEERLLTDLFRPHQPGGGRERRRMLFQDARDDESVRRERSLEPRLAERRLEDGDVGERRIAEHEVVRSGRGLLDEREHVGGDDLRALAESDRRDVLPKGVEGRRRSLDERDARRAARERLDAERAGAGEEVESARVGDDRPEDPEERLADPVGRRPRPSPAWRVERAALGASRDDAHYASAYRRQSAATASASDACSGRSSCGSPARI